MEGEQGQAYRPDIDGLRAVAVGAVLIHHLNAEALPGGYLGVDIFFVISGYLIGGLLLQEARTGRIDIVNFYHRRILRIIPAYTAMMLVAFIAGLAILAPKPLMNFAGAAANALVFLSNFYFARNADYFDATTTQNPLLHTWSLSVEEQFYVVFPLLLLAMHRAGLKRLGPLLAGLFAISVAVTYVVKNMQAGYFWPHTRAVELLTGVLATAFPWFGLRWRAAREISNIAALATLIVCFFLFDDAHAIPHLWPLIPCFACAALLANGRQGESLVASTLAVKPIVGIGLISYSLYLIHWPIITYARQLGFEPETPLTAGIIVLMSLVLAVLSWRYIEQPARRRRHLGPRFSFRLLVASSGVLLVSFIPIAITRGLPWRFSPEVRTILSDQWKNSPEHACMNRSGEVEFQWKERAASGSICRLGQKDGPATVALWGDSHASSIAQGVGKALSNIGTAGVLYAQAGCMLGLNRSAPPLTWDICIDFNNRTLNDILASDAKVVVLHARWMLWVEGALGHQAITMRPPSPEEKPRVLDEFRTSLSSLITKFHQHGKRALIIGPAPDIGYDVRFALGSALKWKRPPLKGFDAEKFRAREAAISGVLEKVVGPDDAYIDLATVLCDASVCPVAAGDVPYYNDSNHMSGDNARRASDVIAERLRKLLAQ